jgi:hypothetical protein
MIEILTKGSGQTEVKIGRLVPSIFEDVWSELDALGAYLTKMREVMTAALMVAVANEAMSDNGDFDGKLVKHMIMIARSSRPLAAPPPTGDVVEVDG